MRHALAGLLVLALVTLTATAADKKLLILAGSPSHGYMEHEYRAGCLLLQQCLANTPGLQVTVVSNDWPKDESVFDIGLERAVALLKEPKAFNARGALKVLGKHPADNQPVALYSGKYGPYVKHGKVNATLPDKDAIGTITLEEAVVLLAAKSKKSKGGFKPRAKRAA